MLLKSRLVYGHVETSLFPSFIYPTPSFLPQPCFPHLATFLCCFLRVLFSALFQPLHQAISPFIPSSSQESQWPQWQQCGGQRGPGALCVLRCPGRALWSCLLEELTCPCLPMFLLSMAVSQWVGQTPCVTRGMGTLG